MRQGATSSQRMLFVDVLRGIALLSVLFHHLPDGMSAAFGALGHWGGRGVDLFFVLSGFLIGTTCLERVARAEAAGPVAQAKAYWVLRSARILPLYLALLGLFLLGVPGLNPRVGEILREWWPTYLTFTSNSFGQDTLELGVLWSLAIEEQFYLAVGVLILLCARSRAQLASAFLGLALAAVAVSLVFRHVLLDLHQGQGLSEPAYIFRLFHGSLSRIDQLAIGLVCALVAPAFNRLAVARSPRLAMLASWAGVALTVGFLCIFPHLPVVGFTAIGVFFAGCVLWAQRPAAQGLVPGRVQAALSWPLRQVGQLSFGLYLFHPITRRWVWRFVPQSVNDMGGLVHAAYFMVAWVALTVVFAALSYHFFEEPLLARARSFARRLVQRGDAVAAEHASGAGLPAARTAPGK